MTFEKFIKSRRTEATRKSYTWFCTRLIANPDKFAAFAKKRREEAEDQIIDVVINWRDIKKKKGITIRGALSAMKAFLNYENVLLNWDRIKSSAPPAKKVGKDRAPTVAEMRAFMTVADPREKVSALMMSSGGPRVGALPTMKVGDVEILDGGVSRVTVYRGEDEEYATYCTPEFTEAYQFYLAQRKAIGEKITPDSPVFRDVWAYENAQGKKSRDLPWIPHAITRDAIQTAIERTWWQSGVRKKGDHPVFKMAHGMRKYCRTHMIKCPDHGTDDSEALLGHFMNYYKPEPEHLEKVFRNSVAALSIDEKYQLRQDIKQKDEEHSAKWQETRLELLETKQRVAEQAADIKRLSELYAERERRSGPRRP